MRKLYALIAFLCLVPLADGQTITVERKTGLIPVDPSEYYSLPRAVPVVQVAPAIVPVPQSVTVWPAVPTITTVTRPTIGNVLFGLPRFKQRSYWGTIYGPPQTYVPQ